MSQEIWSGKRFWLGLRFELASEGTRFGFLILALLSLFGMGCLIDLSRGDGMGGWPQFLTALAGILGVLGTMDQWKGERSPNRAPFLLTLPFSNLEKFTAKLMVSLVLFPLAFVVGIAVIGTGFSGLATLTGSVPFAPVIPGGHQLMALASVYLFFHSIAFAGGLFFRKNVVAKTLLALAGYVGACAILFAIVGSGWAVRVGLVEALLGGLVQGEGLPQNLTVSANPSAWGNVFLEAARILTISVLYIAAWFRYREIEVR